MSGWRVGRGLSASSNHRPVMRVVATPKQPPSFKLMASWASLSVPTLALLFGGAGARDRAGQLLGRLRRCAIS